MVFLGQFSGNSPYLRARIARTFVNAQFQIYHSQSGKTDVVKGAMNDRIKLEEVFVRKYQTLKSYGTLASWPCNVTNTRRFPKLQQNPASYFEEENDDQRFQTIQWAVPR